MKDDLTMEGLMKVWEDTKQKVLWGDPDAPEPPDLPGASPFDGLQSLMGMMVILSEHALVESDPELRFTRSFLKRILEGHLFDLQPTTMVPGMYVMASDGPHGPDHLLAHPQQYAVVKGLTGKEG